MHVILLSLATLASTFAGGLFALRFQARLRFILAFSAGVLLGVVTFDILPEIFRLAGEAGATVDGAMIALVAGFLAFHAMEKLVLVHHAHESDYATHHHPRVGVVSALALSGHSFMDGIAIGVGFQASTAVGVAVAIAVIAHDFCDGLNTVGVMLIHRNSDRRALAFLALDAIAPVLGAASTLLFRLPHGALLLYLGFFAGFLLYIGASDILPEAHSQSRASFTGILVGLTCLGAAFIYVVVRVLA